MKKFFEIEKFYGEFDTFFGHDMREPSLIGRGIKVTTNNGDIIKIWMGSINLPPSNILFNGQNMAVEEFKTKFPTIYKEVFK